MNQSRDQRLEFFFEISIDLMCIAGVDAYFKRVNPAFTKKLGFTSEELLSKPFIEFVHPADRERTLNEVRRLASGVDTVYFENRYRCTDGSWKWLAWTCPAATPEEGLLYAVARDITEQKKLQEQLVQLATYDSLTGLVNRALFLLVHLPRIPLRCIRATLLRNPVRETVRYGLYGGCRVTGIPTVRERKEGEVNISSFVGLVVLWLLPLSASHAITAVCKEPVGRTLSVHGAITKGKAVDEPDGIKGGMFTIVWKKGQEQAQIISQGSGGGAPNTEISSRLMI